ncbi:hypothetical protein GGU11DRAFT_843597 [Lentinula aff. detonsa]|nr:hypothetical protein GGU11DRAFT_843597 [Lentinula aff. detonsa]
MPMTYTTLPDHLNRNKSAYNPLSGRLTSFSIPSSRQLLSEVSTGIQADENNVRTLLQAFDIYEDCELEDEASLNLLTPSCSVLDALNAPTETNTHHNSSSLLPPTHSENPFLSTPLRSKYFPRLSPSILRQLLRSPSPNLYTPSSSFKAVSSPTSISLSSIPSVDFSDVQKMSCTILQANTASSLTYPLTPPLTARIPCTDSHETPVRMLHSPLDLDMASTPGLRIGGVDLNSVPDIRACLSSMTPFTANDTSQSERQKLAFSVKSSATAPAARSVPLLSSATPNSDCSPDGLGEETADERRTILASLLRDSAPIEKASPLPSVRTRALPSTSASPLARSLKVVRSTQGQKPGRVLQREFAELLEARAMEEEEQARELDRMAKRLQRLALQRRRLVALMIEQTD